MAASSNNHIEKANPKYVTTITDISARLSKYNKWFLLAPVIIFMLFFFAAPLIALVRMSLYEHGSGNSVQFYVPGTFTFQNYAIFFTSSYFLGILLTTIKIAAISTAIIMIIAYPFSVYIYKAPKFIKSLMLFFVILPKLTNMLVLVYGVMILLGSQGILNKLFMALGIIDQPVQMFANLFSTVFTKVLIILPYAVLVIVAFLHGLDTRLEDAARGMGAGRFRAFWEITFKLSLPGVMTAFLISLIWGLGAFVSPLLMGNPNLFTLAVEVQRQTFDNVNWAMGATVAVISTILVIFFVVLFFMVQNRFEQKDG